MGSGKHSELKGTHAFLSPSQYSWMKYDEEQLISRFKNSYASAIGTLTHELAAKLINKRIRLTKGSKPILLLYLVENGIPEEVIEMDSLYPNLVEYVNDAISLRMIPEEILYYSEFCYGTVDAYSFRKGLLRIHDLKTGKLPAKMDQLEGYAALFCLENSIKPETIEFELRIYQSSEVIVHAPSSNDIRTIMDTIVTDDKILHSFITRSTSYNE